jgi:hypothetical protein
MTDVLEGDLIQWVQTNQSALLRLRDELFAPEISDETLRTYDLSGLEDPQPAGVIDPAHGLRKQAELIVSARLQIQRGEPVVVLVKQGGGKTLITCNALKPFIEGAWARGERFRSIIVCPKHLLEKWKREFEQAIPGVQVLLAEEIDDVDPTKPRVRPAPVIRRGRMSEETYNRLQRKAQNPHPLDADVIVIAYTDLSLSADRAASANIKPLVDVPYYGGQRRAVRNEEEFDPKTGAFKLQFVLTCPDCGQPLGDEVKDGTLTYLRPADLQKRWRRCQNVKTRLVLDPAGTIERASLSYGPDGVERRVVRKYRRETVGKCNAPLWQYVAAPPTYSQEMSPTALEARKRHDEMRLHKTPLVPAAIAFKPRGSRKMDLSSYLMRHFNGYIPPESYQRDEQGRIIPGTGKPLHFDMVVIDEAHQTKAGDSARGMAAANIASIAKTSVMVLTATVTGGYASSIFYLLWRFTPRIRRYFKYSEVGRFVDLYGARSFTWKENDDRGSYDVGRQSRRKSGQPTVKEIPGLSPEAYLLFWAYTLFAELEEIFPNLPPYRDLVDVVPLDNEHVTTWTVPELAEDGTPRFDKETKLPLLREYAFTQKAAYEYIRTRLEGEAKAMLARGDKGLLAAMLQTLLRWPNCPTEPVEIIHPRTKQVVVSLPGLSPDYIYPKEQALIDQIIADTKAGHKSIVFVSHTGKIDVSERLVQLLRRAEVSYGRKLHIANMRAGDVKAVDRERWIAARVKGSESEPSIDVLVCNPRLVDTGLDLVAFSRTHFVELDYSIYVMAQASRRTLRPGQTRDVLTHYWVYGGTIETGASKLMAQKARELSKVTGSDLDEQFMTQAGAWNLQEWLTRELTKGFKDATASAADIQAEFDRGKKESDESRAARLGIVTIEAVVQEANDLWQLLDEDDMFGLDDLSSITTPDGLLAMPGVILEGENHLVIETPMTPGSPAIAPEVVSPQRPKTWADYAALAREQEQERRRMQREARKNSRTL